MGTLLEWFRTRRQAKILRMIKEHAKEAYNCVVQYKEAALLFFEGNSKATKSAVKKVNAIENTCDDLRRAILKSLTKGELAPQIRNDLAHLINWLDNVADAANAAARHLGILKPEFIEGIHDNFLTMIDKSIDCAEILRNAIEIELEGSIEEVDKSITKIHRLEQEVDEIHYIILERLQESDFKEVPAFVALNIHQLIGSTESITDSCEATADFVKTINLRASSKIG